MEIKQFQAEVAAWADYNFANQKEHIPLLGAVEELGELAHAHIKLEQGIRGTPEEHIQKKKDAIGDVLVYLAHYCHNHKLSLNDCVELAWGEVKHRDWIRFPLNGVDK